MAESPQPGRVLIVRPSALGDVCRSVPVLASLRAAFPNAAIDWVVRDSFVAAVSEHPMLDEAIAFPRSRFARWWRDPAVAAELWRWQRDLRRRGYDLVVDCQGLVRSALITRATGASRRVGASGSRELSWLGYNVRHAVDPSAHAVDRMLALLEAEGIDPVPDMRLYASAEDRRWWSGERERLGVGDAAYAVLAPTARWASKRWPSVRWRALAGPLRERRLEHLVVLGGPDERGQVAPLFEGRDPTESPFVDLVGRTSIGRMMAVVAAADLVVANDSAPLHLAIGFDRPCVGLFGPTDPRLVGPYGRSDAVVCAPPSSPRVHYRDRRIGDALMRAITVEAVIERIDAVLGAPATPARVVAAEDRLR